MAIGNGTDGKAVRPKRPPVTIFRAAPYRSHLGQGLTIRLTICDQVHFHTAACLDHPQGVSSSVNVYICSLVFAIEFVFVLLECSIHHPPRPLYAKSGTFVLHELSWLIKNKFCIFVQAHD